MKPLLVSGLALLGLSALLVLRAESAAGDDIRRRAALAGKLSPVEGAAFAKEIKALLAEKGDKLDQTDTTLAMTACKNLEQVIPNEIGALYGELIDMLSKCPKATGPYLNMMKGQVRRTIGQQITVFTGTTVAGEPFDFEKYKGKVVLFDFWATWCGPCKAEMPNILKMYEKHHDQGFEVVSISIDNEAKSAIEYMAEKKYPWTCLHEHPPKKAGTMCEHYQIPSVPYLFLIDRDGKVAYVKNRGGEPLREVVEKLMAVSRKN